MCIYMCVCICAYIYVCAYVCVHISMCGWVMGGVERGVREIDIRVCVDVRGPVCGGDLGRGCMEVGVGVKG